MAEYRKKKGKDTWHWCRNCEKDPKSDYDSQSTRSIMGPLRRVQGEGKERQLHHLTYSSECSARQ